MEAAAGRARPLRTKGMGDNSYLEQVVAKQQALEVDLKARNKLAPVALAQRMGPARRSDEDSGRFQAYVEPAEVSSNAVDVRITGFWRWKTVLVPPNAYVVHTRKGKTDPLHIGLGVSFSFDPTTDSFLVVPGAMQTILINAHCICKELQGLLVQGYVQWIIADFATAYRKLDFGDDEDPMRLVNLQLREQAEAAIKDKVATMSIDSVLSDKQPIIEELTARLRHVAEGEGGTDKGLGLRIVTVQIKEAVVSSARLWENLQKPFRADRHRLARLAELESEEAIAVREAETQKKQETSKMETGAQLAVLRARNDAEAYDRDAAEKSRRSQREQDDRRVVAEAAQKTALHAFELEKKRHAAEAELQRTKLAEQQAVAKLTAEAKAALDDLRVASEQRQARQVLETLEAKQKILNDVSPGNLQAKMIETLPHLIEKLPKPAELRSVSIGGGSNELQSIASVVAQVMGVVKSLDGKST